MAKKNKAEQNETVLPENAEQDVLVMGEESAPAEAQEQIAQAEEAAPEVIVEQESGDIAAPAEENEASDLIVEENPMGSDKKKKDKKKKDKKSAKAFWISLLCIVLVLGALAGAWLMFSDYVLVMKDVTVAGISMEGMTKKEAKDALAKAENTLFAKNTMRVTVMDTTLEISPKDAGIAIDEDKAIDYAYKSKGVVDIGAFITAGKGLDQVVNQLCEQYNTDPAATTYSVEGVMPDLKTGAASENQTLTITIGYPKYVLDKTTLRKTILSAYGAANFDLTAECQVTPPEMLGAEELYEKYLTAPVNATMDKKFVVTPETYGYSVDPEQAKQIMAGAKHGDTVKIPFAKVAPTVTAESLLAKLFKDVLGECSTPYSGSDNNSRNTNLGLACKKLNGVILLPGETFSYNKTLGERTAANGWKSAPSYVNGLTVDTYGGGVCQGSTTLYNCVLLADLKINEKYPHSYISSYIGPGLDASVNWPSADFRFTNTTNYPIKIEAYRKGGKMTMRLIGTDEKDYYVKMTYKVVSSRAYSTQYEEVDPANNPNGYRDGQQLISPYTGYRVLTYKNRYDKQTNKLIETKQECDVTYKYRDRVVVKFIDTTPTTTTTPPTSSSQTPPTSSSQTPTSSSQTPTSSSQTPTSSSQTPTSSSQTPTTTTQAPTTTTQTPTTTTQASSQDSFFN